MSYLLATLSILMYGAGLGLILHGYGLYLCQTGLRRWIAFVLGGFFIKVIGLTALIVLVNHLVR